MNERTTRDFYDHLSGVYDLLSHASEASHTRCGVEALAPAADEAVLEVGFGTGNALVALARRAGRVVGVDVSEGMVEQACRRLDDELEEERRDAVELHRAACPPLPFADGRFDAVFFSFTLELFEESARDELLAEVRRVLRPAGRLGIVAMARPTEAEGVSLLERGYQWMHRHFPHIVDCAPMDVEEALGTAGFDVIHSERRSMWSMPVTVAVGRRTDPGVDPAVDPEGGREP